MGWIDPIKPVNQTQLSKLLGRKVEIAPLPVEAAYPRRALHWEVGKAGLGIAGCLAMIIGLQPSLWFGVPLAGAALMFGYYLWQQIARYALRIRIEADGASLKRDDKWEVFPWDALKDFRLEFYANGRKAQSGSLVIRMDNGQARLKVDSTLDHFPTLLQYAGRAAKLAGTPTADLSKGTAEAGEGTPNGQARLTLHPTTAENLEKLGF